MNFYMATGVVCGKCFKDTVVGGFYMGQCGSCWRDCDVSRGFVISDLCVCVLMCASVVCFLFSEWF